MIDVISLSLPFTCGFNNSTCQSNRSKMISIKALAESPGLTSIPPAYAFTHNPNDQPVSDDPEDSILIVDFSLLTSGTPDQRSRTIHHLGKACQDWGFFMVIKRAHAYIMHIAY
jgi:hypothetical protein